MEGDSIGIGKFQYLNTIFIVTVTLLLNHVPEEVLCFFDGLLRLVVAVF